jgi:flagellar biosynthesis protein FlhF
MRLRSFTGKNLPDAMRRVRDTLGPEAVILSTQTAETGGGVRVTAALEDSPLEDFDLANNSGLDSIDDIAEALAYHRFPPGLLDRLLAAAANLTSSDPALSLAGALDSEFSFAPLPAASPPAAPVSALSPPIRPIMVIGPHGAGKTATAAKLCARVRLMGGTPRLITMDTEKSGGLAQATAFAQALGVDLEQAPDGEALAARIGGHSNDRLTIIDTAGANPFDERDMKRLSTAAKAADASLVLILPAGGDALESAEMAVAFAGIGADRLIGTRLDIARRLGGMLSATQAGNLALMAVSTSPNIGDPLLSINPVSLARLLLPGPAEQTETYLAREIG